MSENSVFTGKSSYRLPCVVIIIQSAFNPILVSFSGFQLYLASALILIVSTLNFILVAKVPNVSNDSFPNWIYFTIILNFLISVLIHGQNEYAIANISRISMLFISCKFLFFYSRYYARLINIYFISSTIFSVILDLNLITSGYNISNRISPIGQGSANAFGSSLAIICLLRLSINDEFSKLSNRFTNFIGLPIIIFTIIGTFSRGALVGFIFGLLILLRRKLNFRHIPKILTILIFLLLFLQIYGITKLAVPSRYSTSSFSDSSGRTLIFENAISAFSDNPIFGAGVGAKLNPYTTGEASTHNVFLQVLGESGLLGMLILIIALTLMFVRYRPMRSAPALYCLLIVSLTDNHFLAVQFHLVLGLLYLMLLNDKANIKKE